MLIVENFNTTSILMINYDCLMNVTRNPTFQVFFTNIFNMFAANMVSFLSNCISIKMALG